MDQAIGIVGQAVLLVAGLVLLVVLVFLLMIVIRAIKRLWLELNPPKRTVPPTDAYTGPEWN
jgi:hypothetical protein